MRMKKFVPALLLVLLVALRLHAREPAQVVVPDSLNAPVDTVRTTPLAPMHPDTSIVHPAPAPRADALAQVVGMEEKRRTAMVAGDTHALTAIIAEDATYVHSTGMVQTREELFRLLLNKTIRYLKFEIEKQSYRVYGTTVVGVGVQKIEVMSGGQSRVIHSRYTVVYAMKDGAERLIAYQSTPLPDLNPVRK